MESSLCEKPERHTPRRLSDHLMLEGQRQKVHSLVDKVYSRENLRLAWGRVRANQGASGADRVTIEDFEASLDDNLDRLHRDLREQTYQPRAVRRLESAGRTRNTTTAQSWSCRDRDRALAGWCHQRTAPARTARSRPSGRRAGATTSRSARPSHSA